jgi:hypothetical protein
MSICKRSILDIQMKILKWIFLFPVSFIIVYTFWALLFGLIGGMVAWDSSLILRSVLFWKHIVSRGDLAVRIVSLVFTALGCYSAIEIQNEKKD